MVTLYRYQSPIGTMFIKFNPSNSRFNLIINGEDYGSYHSADAAADDVYNQVTGCHDWDEYDLYDDETILDVPSDIFEWKKIS